MMIIYIPSDGPESWRLLLADPEKHWRTGYSAKTLAHCWEESNGFPRSVRNAFRSSPIKALQGIEPLLIIPEHKVPLAGSGKPSQNDIFVLASTAIGLAAICVEGKVAEPFGETVKEWDPKSTQGKATRLTYLLDLLGLSGREVGHLQYQLLHRTASAIIEAKRFHASIGVMLVHSFSQEHHWFEEFGKFVRELGGTEPKRNEVVSAGKRSGVNLYIGWVVGEEKYLKA